MSQSLACPGQASNVPTGAEGSRKTESEKSRPAVRQRRPRQLQSQLFLNGAEGPVYRLVHKEKDTGCQEELREGSCETRGS